MLWLAERLELLRDRARLGCVEPSDAQAHDVEHVEPEVAQVAVDLRSSAGGAGVWPSALLVVAGADLGDEVPLAG